MSATTTTRKRKSTRKKAGDGKAASNGQKRTRQEQAVADYLALLHKPAALIDWDAVAAVQQELEAEDDPVRRLELRAHLQALGEPDREAVEAGFVKHAKAWADANGVSLTAFAAEGVEPRVLRRAGFRVPRKSRGSKQ